MKFAAIALMALVMFSADAEAKRGGKRRGITAKCGIPASEAEDAIKGGFFLQQKLQGDADNAWPIKVGGKVWNADNTEDYSAQLYADNACGGAADGDVIALREGKWWRNRTSLRGKWGLGDETQVSLLDQTDKSLALLNLAGDVVACCPITDIVDNSVEVEGQVRGRKLLDDMFDQN